MKTNQTAMRVLSVLCATFLFLGGCAENAPAQGGTDPGASAGSAESAAQGNTIVIDGGTAYTVPEITSGELTGFLLEYADPENAAADAAAAGFDSAAFSFRLLSADGEGTQCEIDARPYGAESDAGPLVARFAADKKDLDALQALVAQRGLIARYCDYDDETGETESDAYARLTLEYASGESAYHYANTVCDMDREDLEAVHAFFYGLLDTYRVAYYGHPVTYQEESDFVEAFMGTAPWDGLEVSGSDGEAVTLMLSSDVSGRVFRLTAGEDVYAGNYKLKKKEEDGRWRLDLTLTKWPASYTPMTKGGSILIDTSVHAPDADGMGGETLVIAKYPNQASLFDPYYGEEAALTFTRNRTSFFDEKPFATEQTEAAAESTD